MKKMIVFFFVSVLLVQCKNGATRVIPPTKPATNAKKAAVTVQPSVATAAEILSKQQIPVLCYHHIRNYTGKESASSKVYTVPPASFKEQIKTLADSGFHTITPEQHYRYLLWGEALPERPVVISFDDTDGEQFEEGAAVLDQYQFKGVFFIMTIAIGKPNYMTKEQIKALSDKGHIIGAHTWDHHNVKQYVKEDYEKQLAAPLLKLEQITGKPVEYFAYPFGLWDEVAAEQVSKYGYKMAYQLAAKKQDSVRPQYSVRRIIVPGNWSGPQLLKRMRAGF